MLQAYRNNRITKSLGRTVVTACMVVTTPVALAEWSPAQENIGTYLNWIYTPASTLANGKRGLMVVLHGCAQTNTELKLHGNLASEAEASGMVLVIPQADAKNQVNPGCWDYDRGMDKHSNVAAVVSLTRDMIGRTPLNIDTDHVYVVGLSSGAALSLLLGCTAPDLFAGVGAIAGPSVGSVQALATEPRFGDVGQSERDVKDAADKCRSLGSGKTHLFKTQITNIAYGAMDKDGSEDRFDFCLPFNPFCFFLKKHPGEYRVVSVKWSEENIKILRDVYGGASLGNTVDVQAGKGLESNASGTGKTQLALLVVPHVGHAWPAGTGQSNGPGGDWIAQSGLNYPKYITGWLLRNNLRAPSQ